MDREPVTCGSVAILGGHGLGDNLIQMVLAQNAVRCGYATTMYSDVLYPLAAWFPQHRMAPSLAPERLAKELVGYDWILAPELSEQPVSSRILDHWVGYERLCGDDQTHVANMVAISQRIFALDHPTAENGIVAPAHLARRRFPNRVCIHPTSAELSKNWLPERFLQLAQRLTAAGFAIFFIMSESESLVWRHIVNEAYPVLGFANVADCAEFIYESGYFIGNDSGGGHLASCLGIPTLSLHGRKGKARRWQPGWGAVKVVTPRFNLIGSYLRQRYWKYFLPVVAVERSFFSLVRMVA
jgi:hypothetical protein